MAAKNEKTETETTGSRIKIQYYRSSIGYSTKQKTIVRSLGLTKLNQVVEKADSPAMRGTVKKIPHLLRIID
jgi:large subunit ribosomal protein L30